MIHITPLKGAFICWRFNLRLLQLRIPGVTHSANIELGIITTDKSIHLVTIDRYGSFVTQIQVYSIQYLTRNSIFFALPTAIT